MTQYRKYLMIATAVVVTALVAGCSNAPAPIAAPLGSAPKVLAPPPSNAAIDQAKARDQAAEATTIPLQQAQIQSMKKHGR